MKVLLLGEFLHRGEIPGYDTVNKGILPATRDLPSILQELEPWKPDLVVFRNPEFYLVPEGLEDSPCPAVALVGDWNLGFSSLMGCLGAFNYIFTDRLGVERLRIAGYRNVEYMPLYGFDPELHRYLPEVAKEYDVTIVGNFNHDVQRERAFWLERVARFGGKHKVRLISGAYGEEYVRILNASRITFNRSIRKEMNMRAYEAAACKSLIFLEEDNLEVRDFFQDRVHCILYNDRNLEELLEYYLARCEERDAIVERAYEEVQNYSHPRQLLRALDRLQEIGLDTLRECRRPFREVSAETRHRKRFYHVLHSVLNEEWSPAMEKTMAWLRRAWPEDAEILNNDGALRFSWHTEIKGEARERMHLRCIELFGRALEKRPDYLVALNNMAVVLIDKGEEDLAEKILLQALNILRKGSPAPDSFTGMAYPREYRFPRVEAETILARFAGDPPGYSREMKNLYLWKLSLQLGHYYYRRERWYDALALYRQAHLARPDHGEAYRYTALIHVKQGKPELAKKAYSRALKSSPMDGGLWYEMAKFLVSFGFLPEGAAFIEECLGKLESIPSLAKLIPSFNALKEASAPWAGARVSLLLTSGGSPDDDGKTAKSLIGQAGCECELLYLGRPGETLPLEGVRCISGASYASRLNAASKSAGGEFLAVVKGGVSFRPDIMSSLLNYLESRGDSVLVIPATSPGEPEAPGKGRCVMPGAALWVLRRALVQKVGFMDELYETGKFALMDYEQRLRDSGAALVILEGLDLGRGEKNTAEESLADLRRFSEKFGSPAAALSDLPREDADYRTGIYDAGGPLNYPPYQARIRASLEALPESARGAEPLALVKVTGESLGFLPETLGNLSRRLDRILVLAEDGLEVPSLPGAELVRPAELGGALEKLKPSWILLLRGDEIPEDLLWPALPELLQGSWDAYGFELCHMFEENRYRVDGRWAGKFLGRRLIKYSPERLDLLVNPGAAAQEGLRQQYCDIRIRHLGWRDPGVRVARYRGKLPAGFTDKEILALESQAAVFRNFRENYPRVLVASPVRNAEDYLESFLQALGSLDYPRDKLSFYFLLNDCTDRTAEILRDWKAARGEGYEEVALEEINLGGPVKTHYDHNWVDARLRNMSYLRNRCFRALGDRDFLLLLDCDLLLQRETLKHLVNLSEKDLISEVFWTDWNEEGKVLPNVWSAGHYTFTHDLLLRLESPTVEPVGGLGALTLISRRVVESGVSYDPIDNLGFWGEDRAFGIRARASGIRMLVDTHYPAYHLYRPRDLEKLKRSGENPGESLQETRPPGENHAFLLAAR